MSSRPLAAETLAQPRTAARNRRLAAPNWPVRIERTLLVSGLVLAAVFAYQFGEPKAWDVQLYQKYASGFWLHWPPHLPVEYPPLSVLPFAIALVHLPIALHLTHHHGLVPAPALSYSIAMGLLVLVGHQALIRYATPLKASAFAVYILAGGAATVLLRFDLAPALITLAALWMIQRRRFGLVYALLAAGTLMKLFPAALIPVAAIAQWHDLGPGARARWKQIAIPVAGAGAAISGGFATAWLVDPAHGLGAFTYTVHRPVQVESVPATVVWIASLFGVPAVANHSFASFNLLSPISSEVVMLGTLATVAGCLFVYWRQLQGRLPVGHAAIASILVLMCTTKVLSPQYMIWLVPLVAVVLGFEIRWLLLFALTSLIYPILYQSQIKAPHSVLTFHWPLLAAIATRNLLLVGITIRLAFAPAAEKAADRISGAVVRVRNPQTPRLRPAESLARTAPSSKDAG